VNAKAADTTVLTRKALLSQKKFWLVLIGVSGILLPGFGVKLLIGPQLYAVYRSSQATQDAVSAVFLVSYAVMRLGTGISADRFNVKIMYAILGSVQLACVSLLGFCVFFTWPEAWFIGLSALLSCCMAGSKVLFSILCLKVWGPKDTGLAFGMVCPGWGLAALLSSTTAWAALCQTDTVNGVPVQGAQTSLQTAFGLWFWLSGVCTFIGASCIMAAPVLQPAQLALEK
jgi:MFS family permease